MKTAKQRTDELLRSPNGFARAKRKADKAAYMLAYLTQEAHDNAVTSRANLNEINGWDPAGAASGELVEALEALDKAIAALRKAGAKEEV